MHGEGNGRNGDCDKEKPKTLCHSEGNKRKKGTMEAMKDPCTWISAADIAKNRLIQKSSFQYFRKSFDLTFQIPN